MNARNEGGGWMLRPLAVWRLANLGLHRRADWRSVLCGRCPRHETDGEMARVLVLAAAIRPCMSMWTAARRSQRSLCRNIAA